ncbi:MAG: glycoside hydrolase family 127 protein [Terriglobales bacterium]
MVPWNRRAFVATTAAAVGAALVPARTLAAIADGTPAGAERTQLADAVAARVTPFPMTQVRLLDGPFLAAQERNRAYLHALPPDRLLHMFRLTAGLESRAEPLGGWEKPACELRGHFTGGHMLSAAALMAASSGDDALKAKVDAMVAELAQCQHRLGNGYLGAYPENFYDRLRDHKPVWAPFYTYHKILAGHLDAYVHCGNQQALATAEAMAGWVERWAEPLSAAHMARVLETEFGGMGEALCNLYALTGKRQYLDTSHRFDKKVFLDPLADRRDELQGLHVNTHVPQVIAAARRYELTGNGRDGAIADYFWDEVTAARSYCTGGISNREFWRTPPGQLAKELGPTTAECCCSYNMLKLTRQRFGWTGDARAMDFYERTLFNHRLGTQNPADGTLMYYLPLASGYWKFFGTPLGAFWCCTGTGAEEFSKFGDSIYFKDAQGVYVNLFIASELNWAEKGVRLRQETRFPAEEGTKLTLRTARPTLLSLHLRIPYWATRGGSVKVNGTPLAAFADPSSYLTLTRVWHDGDTVELGLPMSLHTAPMPDDPSLQAMMYGPLVLAGRLGNVGLTREMQYGGDQIGLKGSPATVSPIRASLRDPAGWLEPVAGEPLTFRAAGQAQPLTLVPLNEVFNERYAVYWQLQDKATAI